MKKSLIAGFERIQMKWLLVKLAEVMFFSAFLTLALWMIFFIFDLVSTSRWLISGGFFLVIFFALAYIRGVFKITKSEIARYLNSRFSELENSTELLLREKQSLNQIENIQKGKIEKIFPSVYNKVKVSNHLLSYLFLLSIAIVVMLNFPDDFQVKLRNGVLIDDRQPVIDSEQSKLLVPQMKDATVHVHPPVYTKRKAYISEDLALSLLENTSVEWFFEFTDSIKSALLIFDNGDTLELKTEKERFTATSRFKKSGFYYVVYMDQKKDTLQSPFYAIKIKQDQPPSVSIQAPEQYLDIQNNGRKRFDLSVEAEDDYGLSASYIVATVSRGSGESVKFREEKLFFDNRLDNIPTKAKLIRSINLDSLEMEPGDELYYYVVVADNRWPQPQIFRTDTYFAVIADTANNGIVIDAGLGVDQMPEYFRSQRQIIIDTEKIIKDALSFSKKDYQTKLNDLGIDQKLLRLRYGQFLGEEFESGITENIEGLIERENEEAHTSKAGEAHPHHEDEQEAAAEEMLLESYMHIHDYQGEATFFDDAIKAQLKAALSQMWEAELRLRTFRPQEALPFEYNALSLIKEIQQKSRVYVERIGFNPPELKPLEKRLTGDLKAIHAQNKERQMEEKKLYPDMREALKMVNGILEAQPRRLAYDKSLLGRAGQEFSRLAVEEPERYLRYLVSFRILANESLSDDDKIQHLQIIRQAMYTALPDLNQTPYTSNKPPNNIYRLFQNELLKQQGR